MFHCVFRKTKTYLLLFHCYILSLLCVLDCPGRARGLPRARAAIHPPQSQSRGGPESGGRTLEESKGRCCGPTPPIGPRRHRPSPRGLFERPPPAEASAATAAATAAASAPAAASPYGGRLRLPVHQPSGEPPPGDRSAIPHPRRRHRQSTGGRTRMVGDCRQHLVPGTGRREAALPFLRPRICLAGLPSLPPHRGPRSRQERISIGQCIL